jgi:steroid 5-alpha reductase family enzyme
MALANGWTGGTLLLAVVQAALFVAYGVRLAGFLLVREIKNAAYRKTLKEATGNDKKMPLFVLVSIWIFSSVLYTAQVSPMFFRYFNGAKDLVVPFIGAVISVLGLVLEAESDRQKSAQNEQDRHAAHEIHRVKGRIGHHKMRNDVTKKHLERCDQAKHVQRVFVVIDHSLYSFSGY